MTGGTYITFRLGDELFAFDVRHVREVLELTAVARLPLAPPHLRGVVNVRGSAITVVDLRSKFGLPPVPDTLASRIVVSEVSVDGEPCVIGGLADAVLEVIELAPGEIRPAPSAVMRWRTELVVGIGQRDGRFIIILDAARLFSDAELAIARDQATELAS
jgi:purine-binding chemotaxis protein CheW